MAEASQTACRPFDSGAAETAAGEQELTCIQRRLLSEPGDRDALGRAGTLLYEMGRFEEAIAHLERSVSLCQCPLCRSDNRNEESHQADKSHPEADDTHYQIFTQLADCYAALNDYQNSENYYHTAVTLVSDRAEAYLGLGTLAMRRQQFDRARAFFQMAGDFHPDCSEAYGGLAMVHQHRKEYDKAFDMYLKCLELDTDNLVALLGLFQTSCEMENFSKIIHYLEIYLEGHPSDTSVLFCLASLYAKEGRFADATEAVAKVLVLEPNKPEAAELLAELKDAEA
jgi:tetratricopeptide (TPR) repeat protein